MSEKEKNAAQSLFKFAQEFNAKLRELGIPLLKYNQPGDRDSANAVTSPSKPKDHGPTGGDPASDVDDG